MNPYAQDVITRLHGRAEVYRLSPKEVSTADLLDEAAGCIAALLGDIHAYRVTFLRILEDEAKLATSLSGRALGREGKEARDEPTGCPYPRPRMSSPHPDPLAEMLTKPHELDGRFEPEAKTVTSDAALTSIAVSLKRIADALDGGSQGIQNTLEQKVREQ